MTAGTDRVVRHALLSGDGSWAGVAFDGLAVTPDSTVELAWIPGLLEPWLRAPGRAEPSGLALDRECGLLVSDAAAGRLVRDALDCGARTAASNSLVRPAGLCVGPFGWLFVADPGAGSVLVFALPELIERDVWADGLDEPVAVAAAGESGVWVLDRGRGRVALFDARGGLVRELAGVTAPQALAAASDGVLYVADSAVPGVLPFDLEGTSAGPPLAVGVHAQALAVDPHALYVADAVSGGVRRLSRVDGRWTGAVEGFRGPASALAVDRDGRLFIKPGDDDRYMAAEPAVARVPSGTLTAGPLDAGESGVWLRLAVDAAVPAQARVRVETALAPDPPGQPVWGAVVASDVLLDGDRHLWVRVTLERGAPAESPSVKEVRAETDGDSYLDYLPEVYSRDPAASDFLRRLLEFARARLGDLDAELEGAPRGIDPATAPAARLRWLAGWEAFDPPPALSTPELRALLAELPELALLRGTPEGLSRFAEHYAGVRPIVVEDFSRRRIWMLDHTSALGFDTALPGDAVDGIVLGASVAGASGPEDPAAWGSALFDETAHRFTVLAPLASLDGDGRERLHRVLEAEKPAHTQYHLCLFDARFRVGVQAQVGVDAIVAGPASGIVLDGTARLNLDSRIADEPEGAPGAVGRRGRLGVDTLVG